RDLLRGSARPGARVRRRRRRARAGAIAARRAPRLARLAALSAAAPRAAGIRPDMTPTYDGHSESSDTIDLPAPTAWPMVLALGITLAFGGLVTHAAISVMGIVLALIAGVGWWREVFPEQRVERITLRAIELRPPTVMPWRPAVERASIGGGGHRARVPVEIQPYSAGIKGGIRSEERRGGKGRRVRVRAG